MGREDIEERRKKWTKAERKKEEVRRRLTRDFCCLKKLTNAQSVCIPELSDSSDSDEGGPDSNSTQPPSTECRMRNPPKYLSARQVWLNRDLSEDNPYRKFLKNAKKPKWHPPWRPPSPPSGWALYEAQVDKLINDLAEWMKQELESPGYQPTATMDAEALRQMFELDLDGYAARKIKVQPRELRCLRISERPAKRHEKADATKLPDFLNILYRVKQMALNDLSEEAADENVHAFGRQLPQGHPKKGRLRGKTELSRWVIARKVHPELADWSNILKGMKDTFIGCAFSNYVNETFTNAPTDSWPSKTIYDICKSGAKPTKFPRLTKPQRSPFIPIPFEGKMLHRVPSASSMTVSGIYFDDGASVYD